MSLPFVVARGCRGGAFAANASGGGTATPKTDEEKIEDGEVGGVVPWIWLDANKINGSDDSGNPSDGNNVSSWVSRSGSRSAVQSTASAQPDWEEDRFNSLPSVEFTAAEYLLIGSEAWNADDMSFFFAGLWGTGYGFFSRWAHSSSAKQFQIRKNIIYASDNGTTTRTGLSWTADISNFRVDSFIKDGTSYAYRRDLSSHASGTEANTETLPNSPQYTVLGGQVGFTNGSGFLGTPGQICELIVWDSALSSDDRDTVESYLSEKYGL